MTFLWSLTPWTVVTLSHAHNLTHLNPLTVYLSHYWKFILFILHLLGFLPSSSSPYLTLRLDGTEIILHRHLASLFSVFLIRD